MESNKVFAIGDIHGCGFTFEELLINICNFQKGDTLFLLGDIIDRGPRIKYTIDLIIDLIDSGYDIKICRGNHEEMLLNSLNSSKLLMQWFKNGGKDTLESFQVLNANYLDERYLNFFESTNYYHLTDDYVLVHSGLNFYLDTPLDDKSAMLWSRDTFVNREKIGGRRLITGHTPRALDTIKQSLNSDNIFLDGGCVYHKRVKGMGYLCAFELNTKELYYLQNIDFN